jgi:hypothetical protein
MFSAPLVAREWGRGGEGDKQQNVSLFVKFLLCDAVYGETTDMLCWLPEPIPLLKNKNLFMCSIVRMSLCKNITIQKSDHLKINMKIDLAAISHIVVPFRKMRLIEVNSKCRHLKKLTCKGTSRKVFIGTPTKRQVSKRQVSKRPVSKRLKRQVF